MYSILFSYLFFSPFFPAVAELKIKSDAVKIEFVVDADHSGSIGGFDATILFDANDLTNSSISGSVDVNTLNTENAKRDGHLKSADYLDAEKYPKMEFKSTAITSDPTGFAMTGLMSIKGIEHEETINFSFADNTFKGTSSIALATYKIGSYAKKKPEDTMITINFVVPVM